MTSTGFLSAGFFDVFFLYIYELLSTAICIDKNLKEQGPFAVRTSYEASATLIPYLRAQNGVKESRLHRLSSKSDRVGHKTTALAYEYLNPPPCRADLSDFKCVEREESF